MLVKYIYVNSVTTLSLFLGLVGLTQHSVYLLGASLLLDAVDGELARSLDATTVFGARFDWHSDCVLAVLGILSLGLGDLSLLAIGGLVIAQTWRAGREPRISGRSAVFGAVILKELGVF